VEEKLHITVSRMVLVSISHLP